MPCAPLRASREASLGFGARADRALVFTEMKRSALVGAQGPRDPQQLQGGAQEVAWSDLRALPMPPFLEGELDQAFRGILSRRAP